MYNELLMYFLLIVQFIETRLKLSGNQLIMFIREVNSIPQGANYSLKVSKVTLQKIEIGALA